MIGYLGLVALGGMGLFAYSKRGTFQDTGGNVPKSPSTDIPAGEGSDPFTRWDSLFQGQGHASRVPWRWMKAICMNESSLGRDRSVASGIADPFDIGSSVSSDGKSWGLMQLTLATAQGLEGPELTAADLNDPGTSVRLAGELLAQLIERFGIDDRESVVRAYNGGPGFARTVSGLRDTPVYYSRFEAHLSEVMAKQPGDELEGYT